MIQLDSIQHEAVRPVGFRIPNNRHILILAGMYNVNATRNLGIIQRYVDMLAGMYHMYRGKNTPSQFSHDAFVCQGMNSYSGIFETGSSEWMWRPTARGTQPAT